MSSKLFEHLDQNGWVLAPNEAIKRHLLKSYLAYRGKPYIAECIMTLHKYVNHQIMLANTELLSSEMEYQLWRHINSKLSASQCMQARSYIQRYQVPLLELQETEIQEGHFAFSNDFSSFLEQCRQLNICTQETAIEQVIAQAKPQKKSLYLYSFLSPIEPLFNQLIKTQFSHIQEIEIEKSSTQAHQSVRRIQNNKEELLCAMKWAQDKALNNPNKKIALLCTQNTKQYSQLLESCYSGLITIPKFLSDQAIFKTALDIFALNNSYIDLAVLQRLVRSPIIGLHQTIDQIFEMEIKLNNIQRLIEREQACKLLNINLTAIDASLTSKSMVKSLLQQLNQCQWMQSKSLYNQNLQEEFLTIIESLEQLEQLTSTISLDVALEYITQACQKQQISDDKNLPIKFITTAASTLDCDFVWILSANQNQWPHRLAPHDYLPLKTQQSYFMPKSCAEIEHKIAHKLLDTLSITTQEIVASFCQDDQCSLLFLAAEQEDDFWQYPEPTTALVALANQEAPPLQPHETISISALELQSSCPLHAFLHHRIGASENRISDIGLDAADKGTLLHAAMQYIWSHLQTSDNLLALSNNQIKTLAKQAVEEAANPFTKHLIFPHLKQHYTQCLIHFLQLEQQQYHDTPFEVYALEFSMKYTVQDVLFNVRVDRIDKLEDGAYRVIDYKTGNPNKSFKPQKILDNGRAINLQIPIYTAALEQQGLQVSATAIGYVHLDAQEALQVFLPEPLSQQTLNLIAEYKKGSANHTLFYPAHYRGDWHKNTLDYLLIDRSDT